jgi:hypothetical protein
MTSVWSEIEKGAEPSVALVLPVPEPIYRAIGHILCQWAYFEQALNEGLVRLGTNGPSPFDERIVLERFGKRLGQWESLAAPEFKKDGAPGHITELCKRIRAYKDVRDEVAHGTWSLGEESITLTTYKHGATRDLRDHDLNAKSLEKIAAAISEFGAELWRLEKLYSERHPSPAPQPLPPK